jgi:hypothetical protein
MAKSDKFDQAIAKVENKALSEIGTDKVKSFVGRANVAEIQALIESDEIDEADQLLTLGEGDQITGEYMGPGTAEIEDLNDKGKKKTVTTHKIVLRDPETWERGPRVSILGAAQLDRQLGSVMERYYIGVPVLVARGATKRTPKGVQMTDYFCAALKSRLEVKSK